MDQKLRIFYYALRRLNIVRNIPQAIVLSEVPMTHTSVYRVRCWLSSVIIIILFVIY